MWTRVDVDVEWMSYRLKIGRANYRPTRKQRSPKTTTTVPKEKIAIQRITICVL